MISLLRSLLPERHPVRIAWSQTKAFVAALLSFFPARKLIIIGVTGTDGKTTTVGMIAHILEQTGHTFGAASTAFFQINGERNENKTHLTSISPFALQRFLQKLVARKCQYAVIEMSSHGLVQGRLNFLWPKVSACTNVGFEHLDYHKTMDQYRNDKGIIFQLLKDGTKVLNASDDSYHTYRNIPSQDTITFGLSENAIEPPDMQITNIEANAQSTSATLSLHGEDYDLEIPIPGIFNLENAACAIACTTALSIAADDAIRALKTFAPMPGRLERIDEGQDFSVFVDFTMTPEAYEKTLHTLKDIAGQDHRVLVLCSCCGNRMKEKRPKIGAICSEIADVVVACEDETYGEDPHAVLDELWAGIDQGKTEAHKIFDRREAITFLLQNAKPGDAVVLCGMGPFHYMTKLEGNVEWDERKVAREILRSRQHAS